MSSFCCGSECGIVTVGAGNVAPHWNDVVGNVVSQTTYAKSGGRAYRMQTTSARAYLEKTPSGTSHWTHFNLYFPTLPAVNVTLVEWWSVAGTFNTLIYRASTRDIVAQIGTTRSTPLVVVAGRWYEVNVAAAVTSPRTAKLTVDGVDKGLASVVITASTFTRFRIGVCNSVSADVVVDDIVTGTLAGDYPLVAGTQVISRQLTADGTHSFSTAGDFKYNNSINVAIAATDTWSHLTGLLSGFVSFLAAAAVSIGEYLEWLHTGMPATTIIHGMELVTTHEGSDLNAHKQTLRLIDGATTVDVFTDRDFSDTTLGYNTKHYDPAPSGVAWTTALLNAIKFRWGSSWTAVDIAGVPYIGGLMMEVACVPTTAPPPTSNTSEEQNPTKTYPQAGTYLVKLTVTDSEGKQNTVTKSVVVA